MGVDHLSICWLVMVMTGSGTASGPAVLQIANLPEVYGPQVEEMKNDLSRYDAKGALWPGERGGVSPTPINASLTFWSSLFMWQVVGGS